jgi:alpha-beta hydrolase superfamily lysophospholipase
VLDPSIGPPTLIDPVDGSFVTRDGLTLSTCRLQVPANGLGPVILIHGLGDHSRSMPYRRLGSFLAAQGFEVFAFDRRGSGRSNGPANYAATWDDLRDDLARFVDIVEDQCGRLPSLVGLSLGGLQALDFALAAPESVKACVAMAPALDTSGTSPWIRRLVPVLARFWPSLSVDPGLDDSALVRDPAVCHAYRDDPLWRARTTPALSVAAMAAIERVHSLAGQIKAPLLILHGTADRVVPIGGTRAAFPRFGSPDKTLVEMPGAFHALPIDFAGDEVSGLISDWLKARAAVRPTPLGLTRRGPQE